MSAGWPEAAGAEWDGHAMSYGLGPYELGSLGPYEAGQGVADQGAAHYDDLSYDPAAYDTLPRGVSAHDALTYGVQFRTAEPRLDAAEEEAYGSSWEFEEGLARLLQTSAAEPPAPTAIPRQRFAHRKRSRRLARAARGLKRLAEGPMPWLRLVSLLIAAVSAVIVAVVGALSGLISYAPLHRLAVPLGMGALAAWWPLLVYGPWLVAALSILRAALHRKRSGHSWVVVLLFSGIAVFLCVAGAGHAPVRLAVSGLPPIAALVCLHQFVRQITLTAPPRNGPRRPRHTVGRR